MIKKKAYHSDILSELSKCLSLAIKYPEILLLLYLLYYDWNCQSTCSLLKLKR